MYPETAAPVLIYDFVDKDGHAQRRTFQHPVEIVIANAVAEVVPALNRIQTFVNRGYFAAGYLSYEAAPAFDLAYEVHADATMPLLWFGIYDDPGTDDEVHWGNQFAMEPWTSDTPRHRYDQNVRAIRNAIAAGETYQVNYTMRLRSHFTGDDLGYYHRLRHAQRADYSAYLKIGRYRILSVSPELFFRIDGNTVITRPMKGTMPRGRWLEEDLALASQLQKSTKDRAENVMIVDLLRNDLARIPGVTFVQVPRLFNIETYPTVYQMTSTVTTTVRDRPNLADVFRALFPCGSITGAPKISTMSLIAQLEQNPREIYCGTIGFIEPGGDAVFNVAIRSVLIDAETGAAQYGVGGGITWDSTSEGEYAEAYTKAALLEASDAPFELLETLKLDHGEYVLLDRHLTRLVASAKFFGIPVDEGAIAEQLRVHADEFPAAIRRVRLLVSQTGEVRVESVPLSGLSEGMQRVAMANAPISRRNRFLYHKTTRREVYQHHHAEHDGVFDVLLWNEDGHVTEFTNGNIVLEIGGRKVTPPRDCGLLAGTFRAKLLDEGVIQESVLTREDVAMADRIWFINSARGRVPVSFGGEPSAEVD